ncbi:MAG: TolC family protein [Elusimicrobiota bacterium]|nr:TolC family protein [Elusimicrobiota bacterium]
MTLIAAALALALFTGPAEAQKNGDALTLDEVVSIAVKNSPAALAAEQNIIIARQRVMEARFMALPQFTLSGTFSQGSLESPALLGPELGDRYVEPRAGDNFYTLRAQALQPLYTGGKNTNTLKLAKTSHNQAKVNFEAVRADAALEAKKAFYTLLYQRRLEESSKHWLGRARELDSSLRKDAFEELEAAILLSGLSDRAQRAGSGVEAALAGLLKALNREPGHQVEAEGKFEPLPVRTEASRSLVTAMEARSELKSELYKAQMDEIAVNMAMIRRNPTINLGASYDVNAYKFSSLADDSARANNWLASIAIHFPLSYDVWTQVRQRKAQQRQGELKRAELQDTIRFEIISAHREAVSWQAEAEKLGVVAARMSDSYETASQGARPSMAALRVLCSLCELEKKAVDAVYNQLLARIRLEWAQGRDFAK